MFKAALFTIAKTWKQPKYPSTDEWIKKMWYIYIYIYIHTHTMEYYPAMPFAAIYLDLENIILSALSQTAKDKCYMISLICGI